MPTPEETQRKRAGMNRREFVARMGAAGAMAAVIRAAPVPGAAEGRVAIVDTNVNVFHWPFRRLPLDSTPALLAKLAEFSVSSAWAGSFEGLLHRDVAGVNERLAAECGKSSGRLLAFGTVNPALPDWEDDLRRCHEVHRMPGIRLHPNYHGYTLENPAFSRLLRAATGRKLIVQVAASMEDVRTQHPMLSVPDVDLRPLPAALRGIETARVQLLNVGRGAGAALLKTLGATAGVYFDTSRVEGTAGIAAFLRSLPAGRVLFGTHAPFFIYEAGLIKVIESGLAGEEAGRLLSKAATDLMRA